MNQKFFINTEQLTVEDYMKSFKKYFDLNIKFLDYSKENIHILNNKYKYKNTVYLPYIYNKDEIYNLKKEKDICTIIPRTGYRFLLLNKIKLKYDFIEGFNKERDEKLFQYKIIINLASGKKYKIF